jgi:hypothetical protein
MSSRVLATDAARQAAADLKRMLPQLQAAAREIIALGDRLANPSIWEGPSAAEFRHSQWRPVRTSLQPTIQALLRLESTAEVVINEILRAGGEGPGSGTTAGGAPVAEPPPIPTDPHQRASWWQSLTPDQQAAYLRAYPADVAYLATLDQLHQAGYRNLQDVYTRASLIDAGIDPKSWDPSLGLKANDATVRAVYAYYQHLFDQNHNLQWAGMAKLAGGTVYGGLMDMYTLSQMQRDPWERIAAGGLGLLLGGPVGLFTAEAVNEGGLAITHAEANKFQDAFLQMQKTIFMDMAWQHAAYTHGGMDAVTALHAADANGSPNGMDNATYAAWQQISSGDPNLVAKGNETLLKREQFQVLQPMYDQVTQGLDGKAFAIVVSDITKSPVPNGKPFSDYPGQVTNFNDRWNWIEQDMLPRYRQLLQNPQQAQQLVDESLRQRGDQFRLLPLHVDGY